VNVAFQAVCGARNAAERVHAEALVEAGKQRTDAEQDQG
jgi:hypothetical protein